MVIKLCIGGIWICISLLIYQLKFYKSNKKIEIWSCRSQLKKIKRINDADKDSIF